MTSNRDPIERLGVTVMPEWFQYEGVDAVLQQLQRLGATALATSPYVMAACPDGEGGREPPADGDAGKVRPLDRPLWGRRELCVRTAPSLWHDLARYRGLRYQPSPPDPLTFSEGGWLDRLIDAATRHGIAVYLQVMAASPPGYRVQFSNALADDQCLGPNGAMHDQRVDRNASLASPHVGAYVKALLTELAIRYPDVAGFRLDWPEYPPYDFRSALFDFNPAATDVMTGLGHDVVAVAREVARWTEQLMAAARGAARDGPAAARSALLGAGWNALDGHGPLAPLFDTKRAVVSALLAACRDALDAVPGRRRRLEPQIFPPPFHRMSGFPLDGLGGIADAVGVKLYTMHWPMLARYWARDLLGGAATDAEQDAVTAAVADLFGLTDALDATGSALRYPEPQQAHPAGTRAQYDKLVAAAAAAAPVPVRAFVHSYGPVADVKQRFDIAASTGLPVWINRYGYLSDEKFAALAN